MLLTPLFIRAQNYNQKITDTLCLHRTLLYWDKNSHKFKCETRKRHLYPWFLGNFGIMGSCGIPCLLAYFFQGLHDHQRFSIIEGMAASLQVFCAFAFIMLAIVTYESISELTSFLNEVVIFEEMLHNKYFTDQGDCGPDTLGILANIIVVNFTMMLFFATGIFIMLDIDFVILPFNQIYPELSFPLKVAFQVIRVIMVQWALMVAFHWDCTYSMIALLSFRAVQACHALLLSQPVSEVLLRELRQFHVLFTVVRDLFAVQFFTVLVLIYGVVVVCTCMVVTFYASVSLVLSVFVCLLWLICVFFTVLLLSMCVSVDSMSSELHASWIHSCGQLKSNRFQMKLIYRVLKSIKPIGIPYGTLGTFTRGTRTDYIYSIKNDSITAILAFREAGY